MKSFILKRNSLGFTRYHTAHGFTLIELLIAIAILGILAAVVVVAVNPLEMLNSARLAKVKRFSASVENLLIISQVGKWSFEEDGVNRYKDTSGYGNNGTAVYNPDPTVWKPATDPVCKDLGFGACLFFPDDGSFSTTPIRPAQLTVAAWVNFRNYEVSQNDYILAEGSTSINGGYGSYFMGIEVSRGGGLSFYIFDGASDGPGAQSGVIPKSGKWYHVVGTFDGREIRIYIDGQLKDKKSRVTNISYATSGDLLYIGRVPLGALLDGYLDEVAIYSKALLSSQIQQLYAQGLERHLFLGDRFKKLSSYQI